MLFRGFQFCLNYSLALVATFFVMLVVNRVPGLQSSQLALVVLPLLVAATIEGKAYARENRSRPAGMTCCGVALRMTAVAAVAALGLLGMGALIFPKQLAALGVSPFDVLGLSVLIFAGIALPVLRCGYSFGLMSELRAQQVLQHSD